MLLGTEKSVYQGHVTRNGAYRSYKITSGLSHWVSSFWQLDIEPGQFTYRSVPDNCVDWIINPATDRESFIISPFATPLEFPLKGPASYFGIRFRVLAYQALTATPIGEWNTEAAYLHVRELLSASLIDAIQHACLKHCLFESRCQEVESVLQNKLHYPDVDTRLQRLIQLVNTSQGPDLGTVSIKNFDLGVSERQLRRLSHLHLGLTVKDFLRVARFQAALSKMNQTNKLQADRSAQGFWQDHYYDQSHFIREFKIFTGTTPSAFSNMSVLYNQ